MSKYSENYRGNNGHRLCELCNQHLDSQEMSFNCKIIKQHVKITHLFSEVFSSNVQAELGKTLCEIDKVRDKLLEDNKSREGHCAPGDSDAVQL